MADRRFEFQIAARDENFSRSMDRIGEEAKRAGAEVSGAFKRAGDEAGTAEAVFGRIKATLAGAFTVGAVVQFGRAIAKEALDAEREVALLNATLRSTGFAAGLSAQNVNELANEISRATSVDAGDILQGTTALLRFRDIGGETFREVSRLAVDLAVATGTAVPEAFAKVGRALQDPVNGARALRDVGVKLTESQAELAKQLRDTGDTAGAQRIVIDELAKSVGGSGAAANTGLTGATQSLARAWEDLLTSIGQLPAVAAGAQNAISGLGSVVRLFNRALTQDGPPANLGGSITVPGVSPARPGRLGQLSAEEVQQLQSAGARSGAAPLKFAPAASGSGSTASASAAGADGTEKIARMGAQMYLDQFKELQRQAKVINDEAKATRLEIEREIVAGIAVGPEQAAKMQKDFQVLADQLIADTPAAREQALVGVGGALDALNEKLIAGKINAEQYNQAFALVEERLGEVRGTSKAVAGSLESDIPAALRSIEQAVQGFGRQFTDTFADIVLGVESDFGRLVQSIARDLLRLQINQSITQPLMAGLSGGLGAFFARFGSAATPSTVPSGGVTYAGGSPFTLGTPKARGGDVFPGMLYPINEMGVEYFAPAVPGKVIPADGLRGGGGGGGTTVIVNQRIDARTDLASIAALGRAQRRAILDSLATRR